MAKPTPIIALIYDFDKTLATDDMQNFGFIPALGMESHEFWELSRVLVQNTGMDKVLAYMYLMIEQCKKKNIPLTREYLNSLGKDVKFFEGVTNWFKRINAFGAECGVKVEHYILSSGTKEIIEGTSIAKEFTDIYACQFLFDENGIASWPQIAINYTTKTQFLFRVSKGIFDIQDDASVNTRSKSVRIPFRNIVYIGDGLTDVPCMTLVKERGGKSIAIYPKGQKEKVYSLYEQDRVNFICRGDYTSNSDLDKIIKLIINQVSVTDALIHKETELLKKS